MGRRSINTTKSGKYMNPTDQARKEARKKELKKNKRQRQMVRAAVLKGKDPYQIISEMERIDQMEYNVLQPSPLNEKVLKDKRKKLKDTLDRVLKMYDKDDPERWAELKNQEADYERRRIALLQYYESVRHAQQVQIDDIPLPIALQGSGMPGEMPPGGVPGQIPLPTDIPIQVPPPHSILRKRSAYSPPLKPKKPPGVPPGPPPELSEDEDDGQELMDTSHSVEASMNRRIRFEDDFEEHPPGEDVFKRKGDGSDPAVPGAFASNEDVLMQDQDKLLLPPPPKPQPTALQQKMLAMAGQDIDQFMREMEEVHKRREADRQADLHARLAAISDVDDNSTNKRGQSRDFRDRERDTEYRERDERRDKDLNSSNKLASGSAPISNMMQAQPPNPGMPPGPPPLMSLPHMMFRPPPPRMGAPQIPGVRLPPGPPPGPPPGLPPRLGMRMPPGPPPGMPPRMMRLPTGVPMPPNMPPSMVSMSGIPIPGAASATPNVVSAGPQLINRAEMGDAKKGATIEAKPQIRNLSADVTRFLPTALRVKRDEKPRREHRIGHDLRGESLGHRHMPLPTPSGTTKDDAYQQFMREMEGLL